MEITKDAVGLNTLEVRNPLNSDLLKVIRCDNRASVQLAISRAAQYDYCLTGWQRYVILKRLCTLIEHCRTELKQIISLESGKTLRDANLEVTRACQVFLLSAEEAKRIRGGLMPPDSFAAVDKGFAMVTREPVGIVAVVTPFNFPLNLVACKVGPALAANNPVIVKPSKSTPVTAMRLVELLREAGLPAEMIQVVVGESEELADIFCTDDRIRKISFTGSAETGKNICHKAGLKPVSLELGGNDSMVILSDADMDMAIPVAVSSAYGNNGERCASVKRFIVEECIADKFIDRFANETRKLRVGDQLDPTVDIGPLINASAAETVQKRIEATIAEGAELRVGGQRKEAHVWPTVLDRVGNDNSVVREETFGPVAPFIRVKDFDQAIDVVNDTAFVLQVGAFTNDLGKAKAAVSRIRASAVMINRAPGYCAEHLPFGGTNGCKYAVEAMTYCKTIIM